MFISYSWCKLSAYYFFLCRSVLIFNHPSSSDAIQLNTKHIIAFKLFILFYAVFICIVFISIGWNAYYDHNLRRCLPQVPMATPAVLSTFDLLISVTLCILLARRLMMVQSTSITNERDIKKYNLLKRCLVLTLGAVISTQSSIIVMASSEPAAAWSVTDIAINSWCILLSFSDHNRLYFKICGPFHRCIGRVARCLACSMCCAIDGVRRGNIPERSDENTITFSPRNISSAVYEAERETLSSLRRRNNNVICLTTIHENLSTELEEEYAEHDNGASKTDYDKQMKCECIPLPQGIEESDRKCVYICAVIFGVKVAIFVAILIIRITAVVN